MYQFYEKKWMYVITASICMTPYALHMTSHPLFMTSHQFIYDVKSTISNITSIISDLTYTYLCNHTHCISITAILGMISHTVYLWHPIHYIYDIIDTMYDNTTLCVVDTTLGICVTSFALLMISHPLSHTTPRFLWCPIHFRHDITPTLSDTTPSVSLSSQPHFVITYPLFYDIIPSLCVTPYALHITSYQLLMSSHYCTYNITDSIYETSSSM